MSEIKSEKEFILVVDDVTKNLQVLGNILMEEGYEIALASDGFEALETVESDKPDLILLDIMMPELSGYDVCRKLKANDTTKEIPIVFLTARSETEDIVKGFSLGGSDYITKPFKREELLARIDTHLKLKRSRDIIVHQNEQLKKLNEEKNEFLGIAAHDLKNPLNSIKGLAELLIMDHGDTPKEEVLEYAELIKSSSEYMLQIIIDLLNVNAIEEGKVNFQIDTIDFVELTETLLTKFTKMSSAKEIKLNFSAENSIHYIDADAVRLQQVIENLVSNAIKFSPFNKNIWIKISDLNNGKTKLEVKDEGPGLTEDDLKKLFGKFARLSAQPTNNENSTGLGLSIVKKLVEGMNGAIRCESVYGEGASFILEMNTAQFNH